MPCTCMFFVCMCLYVCLCLHVFVSMSLYACLHLCLCMYVFVSMSLYVCLGAHLCMYVFVCMFLYVCLCMHVFVSIVCLSFILRCPSLNPLRLLFVSVLFIWNSVCIFTCAVSFSWNSEQVSTHGGTLPAFGVYCSLWPFFHYLFSKSSNSAKKIINYSRRKRSL